MVVVLVISIVLGMSVWIPKGDTRFIAVQSAARELASYLRAARALAMRNDACIAVDFNIANGPGTSGLVLNNWGGGHWYRMLGPMEFDYSRGVYGLASHPLPGNFFTYGNGDNSNNVPILQRRVTSGWIGEEQRLAPRKVRFLALTDLDEGHCQRFASTVSESTFPATYPRPWFGWWDSTTNRLRPWGGYDPALVDGHGVNNAGFYFQGADGAITGCLNPTDRNSTATYNEINFQNSGAKVIFKQGQVRPLVNAQWMDWYFSFRPDGTVAAAKFGEARFESRIQGIRGVSLLGAVPVGDIGDLASRYIPVSTLYHSYNMTADLFPATSFQSRSGYWYITLAPDMQRDTDVYPSADAVAQDLDPVFRVGVNAYGDVRVIQVRNFPSSSSSSVLDTTTLCDANWQTKATTDSYFQYNLATNPDGSPRGLPVDDLLTSTMIQHRAFWYK